MDEPDIKSMMSMAEMFGIGDYKNSQKATGEALCMAKEPFFAGGSGRLEEVENLIRPAATAIMDADALTSCGDEG